MNFIFFDLKFVCKLQNHGVGQISILYLQLSSAKNYES